MDTSWLAIINGRSLGCPSINVSVKSATSHETSHWLRGQNVMLHCFSV